MVSVLGNYYEAAPVIIEQSSILLCASGSVVLGLELTSGELLFSFKGHGDVVSSISYSEFHPSNVTSVSKDGVVITWDVQTRKVLSTHNVGSPIHAVLMPQFTNNPHTGKPDLYLVLKKQVDGQPGDAADAYKFVIFDLDNMKIRRNVCEVIHPASGVCLANVGGTEVILAASKRKLCLVMADSRVGYKAMCPANHSITCVTANTHRDIFITGHSNGEILIWHDIRNWLARETPKGAALAELKSSDLIAIPPPTSSVMHWHSHAVASLSCNNDGSMIYSGGEEGVLVVWQTATGKKAFVPHLGAGMAHIAASNLFPLAVVTTNNNCLRVVNTSSLLESWAISSLCVGAFLDHSFPSDRYAKSLLEVDPKSALLASSGYPGQLQLFDVGSNSVKGIHEVVQHNRVSRTEKHTKVFVPSVSLFKFQAFHTAQSGAAKFLLATVDVRKGEEFAAESSLKFWSWSDAMNSYKLVTHVPRPHGSHRVTCVAFSPASPYYTCASSATDGSVKLWRLDPAVAAGKMFGDAHWACVYSFNYRSAAAGGLSFSSDGSLLAVAHANTISLWDPSSLLLRASIVAPGAFSNIVFSAFIEASGGAAAYLVVGSSTCLAVYDLLTMSMVSRLDGKLSAFSVAPAESMTITAASIGKKASKNKKKDTSVASEEAPTGILSAQGWISVCRQSAAGSHSPFELLVLSPVPGSKSAVAKSATDNDEEVGNSNAVPSPNVVLSCGLSSEATGTTFWRQSALDAENAAFANGETGVNGELSSGASVLVATTAGELVLTNAAIFEQDGGSAKHARAFPQDGTSLGWAEDVARRNETKAAALPSGVSFKAKSGKNDGKSEQALAAAPVKDGWLGEYFDGVSGNVPPVASIYDDFMSSLMKKSSASMAAAAGAAASSNVKQNKKRAAAEVDTSDDEIGYVQTNGKKSEKAKPEDKHKNKALESQHIESFSASGAVNFSQILGNSLKQKGKVAPATPAVENGHKSKSVRKASKDFPSKDVAEAAPAKNDAEATKSSRKREKRPTEEPEEAEAEDVAATPSKSSKKKRKTAAAVA